MPQITSLSASEAKGFLDDAAGLCKERGTSLTPIRRHVLSMLLDEPGGLKAYDLLDRMKEVHASATPPTVYRALDFLIEQGLVHRIARSNQFVACNQGCHDDACLFLVCPECGQVTELRDATAVAALSKSLQTAGHQLAGQEIELSATCGECANQRNALKG